MFTKMKSTFHLAVIGLTILAWSGMASASGIVNGSFESGTTTAAGDLIPDFSGWTLLKDGGHVADDNTWAIVESGTISVDDVLFDYCSNGKVRQGANCLPVTFYASEGKYLAAMLQNGPVVARMYQDITLPADATALSWEMAYLNNNTIENNEVDPGFLSNQRVAIHIRSLDDVILETIFITGPDDPMNIPTSSFSAAISPEVVKQGTVRLDVEVNVGRNFLPVSFDNFRIEVTEVETTPLPTLPPGWGMGKKTGWQGKTVPSGLGKQDKIPPGMEKGQKKGLQR